MHYGACYNIVLELCSDWGQGKFYRQKSPSTSSLFSFYMYVKSATKEKLYTINSPNILNSLPFIYGRKSPVHKNLWGYHVSLAPKNDSVGG